MTRKLFSQTGLGNRRTDQIDYGFSSPGFAPPNQDRLGKVLEDIDKQGLKPAEPVTPAAPDEPVDDTPLAPREPRGFMDIGGILSYNKWWDDLVKAGKDPLKYGGNRAALQGYQQADALQPKSQPRGFMSLL